MLALTCAISNIGAHLPAASAYGLTRPKIALCLGPGGTRAAAHIGVLKAFEESGIPVDVIAGCSMGAIVGGLYAAGVPLDKVEKLCLNGELKTAYVPGLVLPRLVANYLPNVARYFGKPSYAGIFSGQKLEQLIEQQLPDDCRNIEQLKIPFSAMATDLVDGHLYRLTRGNLATAIKASCALPPLIRPVKVANQLFVDGGLGGSIRALSAHELGADLAIAVCVDDSLRPMPDHSFISARRISQRLRKINQADSPANIPGHVDLVIQPQVGSIKVLSGRRQDFERAEEAGYTAAKAAIPDIEQMIARSNARGPETTIGQRLVR